MSRSFFGSGIRITLMFCVLSLSVHAQIDSLNFGPEPKEGISKLALHYLKINFTPAQRATLEQKSLELIFHVDSTGTATLEDVNGVNDQSIIDSLQHTTRQSATFYPAKVNGRPSAAIYSILLEYPTYTRHTVVDHEKIIRFDPPQLDEIEAIETGGRSDCLIGGVVNGFVGNANEHLGIGGGMKVDVMYSGTRGFGGGIFMNIYFSDLKKDYPINTNRNQDGSQALLIIGLALSKRIALSDRREVIAQFEPGYAIQNVSSRAYTNDPDYIQLQGFSPGVSVHYLMQVGKSRVKVYYVKPALFANYLNFHLSIHPLLLDMNEGSGLLWDVGVSWRLSYKTIRSYKFRE